MSNQAVFDAAIKHIRKQRCRSVGDNGGCRYRGPDGTGCAFAPCIEKYDKKMENSSACYFFTEVNEFDQPRPFSGERTRLKFLYDWARDADEHLCESVQCCHDDSPDEEDFMPSFEMKMKKVAKEFELDYEEEQQVATVVS